MCVWVCVCVCEGVCVCVISCKTEISTLSYTHGMKITIPAYDQLNDLKKKKFSQTIEFLVGKTLTKQ
jgi:hypothetical protein